MWTNEKILSFINSIYLRPELWDVEQNCYKDRNRKKESWQSVASEFAITPEEAYKKFRSLRTYAKNEQKKLHKNSGSGGDKIVKWFAYDTISFTLSRDIPESGMDTPTINEVRYFATKFRRHRNISRLVIVKISLIYVYIRISIKTVELTLINSFKPSISASHTSVTMQHIEEKCTLKRYIKVPYESPVATKRSVIASLVVIGMELLKFVSLFVILGPIAFNKNSKSLFDILVKFLKR